MDRIASLIEVIDAPGAWESSSRWEAVEELVELGSPPRAVSALVRLFMRTPSTGSNLEFRGRPLHTFGPSVVEPILHLLDLGLDRETTWLGWACEVLAKVGVRDARIYRRLVQLFQHDEWWAARC